MAMQYVLDITNNTTKKKWAISLYSLPHKYLLYD